jgi:NAD(P)-dependent dehydrogenase (short-subunit alcohol dehydrogenase family)
MGMGYYWRRNEINSNQGEGMKLQDKVALVTGGGKGIGRAIALLFAGEGARVVVNGTDQEAIEAVTKEITAGGGQALCYQADIASEEAVKQMVETTLTQFGKLDILVNNSGIAGPTAPVVNMDIEEWDRTMAVNLTGAMLCAKYALPNMIERQSGAVINITSVGGLGGYALRSPYCASKWAMIGLSKTIALEVGQYGITSNAIAPGPVRGPRIDGVIKNRAQEMGRTVEEVEREYMGMTTLKRMVENEDIAAMALFLASDEGRNITGEVINISAGMRV